MAKDAKATNGIKFEGFIEIEKINKKNHTREVYHNTITQAGKQFLLAQSAGKMLQMSGDIFGNVGCENNIAIMGNNSYPGRYARMKLDITNALLNLSSAELNALGTDTNCINVWDNNFTENTTKLIGYANSNIIPLDNSREGVVDFCKADYMADGFTVAKRWKYAEGVATGTINAIAMMPYACLADFAGEGIKFSKCLDQVNPHYPLYSNMSSGFLIPGVNGYTANNEILLNFSKDGKSRWKYNLATGEITEVASTDPFFIPTPYSSYAKIKDMYYLDGYLYTLECSRNSDSNSYMYVQVFDTNNSMNRVAYFQVYDSTYKAYVQRACFIYYNNKLYVSTVGGWDATNSSYASYDAYKLWELTDSGSVGYYTAAASGQTNYSTLGFTLPSGLSLRGCGLGMYGSNYVLWVQSRYDGSNSTTASYSNNYRLTGYVFSSLSSGMSSLVKILTKVHQNEVFFSTAAYTGSLRIGYDYDGSYSYQQYSDDTASYQVVSNNSNNNGTQISTLNTGCWLFLDGWDSNVFSFVQLTTPVTKTANDIIYVSYGYKIV